MLANDYKKRKSQSEGLVKSWKWATASLYDPRPLYFERHGLSKGRKLRTEPVDGRGYWSCGLDNSGRVVVEHEYNEFGFYETFYDWSTNPLQVAHYDYTNDKRPIYLLTLTSEGERFISSECAAIHGYLREEYNWDNMNLIEVNVSYSSREDGQISRLQHWHTARIFYREGGVVQRVELHWPSKLSTSPEGIVELMFERRGKRIYRNSP